MYWMSRSFTTAVSTTARSSYRNAVTVFNGIESVWNQSKRHLRRFNGILKTSCYRFLKEGERRFDGSAPRGLCERLKLWYQSEVNKA